LRACENQLRRIEHTRTVPTFHQRLDRITWLRAGNQPHAASLDAKFRSFRHILTTFRERWRQR